MLTKQVVCQPGKLNDNNGLKIRGLVQCKSPRHVENQSVTWLTTVCEWRFKEKPRGAGGDNYPTMRGLSEYALPHLARRFACPGRNRRPSPR